MTSGRFSRIYVSGALMLVNILVLFGVLNLVAAVGLSAQKFFSKGNPVTDKYGDERLQTVYPQLSGDEIKTLLEETWARPYVYEPFTQFKERPYQSTYVNVAAEGYRLGKDQAAWPPAAGDINIFVFGGSTTFGYGVEDSETIASHLQDAMRGALGPRVNVYNFGRGYYFSTQERVLFEALLLAGHVPDLAVFIDGLNDFYHYDGKPKYTERFETYMNDRKRIAPVLMKLPVMKLISAMLGSNDESKETALYTDRNILDEVIARYAVNKKIIEGVASSYGVKPLFVWQPVPTYNYDIARHLFAGHDFARHTFSKYGYPLMKDYVEEHGQGIDFLWAADLQQNLEEPLYVDQVHYSAAFSSRLADFIAEYLVKNYF